MMETDRLTSALYAALVIACCLLCDCLLHLLVCFGSAAKPRFPHGMINTAAPELGESRALVPGGNC